MRSTKPLVGGADPGGAVLDAVRAEQELEGMPLDAPSELAAVVGEDGGERFGERLVEGQLAVGEEDGALLRVVFQAQEPLEAGFEVVPEPDTPHATGADGHPGQAQLVGDALGAVRGGATLLGCGSHRQYHL